MNRSLFFIYFCFTCLLTKAQINNPPVVAVDRMNVLYYGVDNPITIGSPVDFSQVKISIINGTLYSHLDSNSNQFQKIVRPSSIKKNTRITVDINGVKKNYEFRVKEIPNPIFKIGPGGTRMTSGSFKAQQVCRAELENFDFGANFSVVSATVYFSGANFSNVQTAELKGNNLAPIASLMQRAVPGTSVTFDNVKVQGPDGRQRDIQGVGIILY